MPDRVTLDVIDRPAGGAAALLRRLVALRRGRPDGIRALIPLGTSRFVETPVPRITPRRVGVLAIWDADADVDARWAARLGTAAARAREHWHVEGEVVRAAFTEPWRG